MSTSAAPLASQEDSLTFDPKFDRDGLITAVVTDVHSKAVLMVAWMNADALSLTFATGEAHFWSRSRKKLWKKGEDSGNVLKVREARTDCDQDTLLLEVEIAGAGVACHTNRTSCFYRKVALGPVTATQRPLEKSEH
jgi:phosphoribosyl-AMP cyclohydrolase